MSYNPTSLDALASYAKGQVVRLPDAADGAPLYVRMRRPSLLDLISHGRIPNPLATTASNLFAKGGSAINANDIKQVQGMVEILHIFVEESFLEPTYQQIKEVGYQLTDEQLMFVFNYVQKGNKALESFRGEPKGPKPYGNGTKVRKNPVGAAGHKG